jgi:hypothetical protein
MHWIRKNNRLGAWAAVFALAIQLVLSFGHVHLDNFQGTSSVTASASQPQPNTPDTTTAAQDMTSAPSAQHSI